MLAATRNTTTLSLETEAHKYLPCPETLRTQLLQYDVIGTMIS